VVAPPAASPAPEPLESASSGRVRTRSLELPLELMLPDRPGWQITDGPLWFVARHAATSSELAVRSWRAARLVRRAECAEQARLSRVEIPTLSEDAIVEQRAVAIPSGFDGELTVGVVPSGAAVRGYAYVFGAAVGHCFAAVYTTEVRGSAQEEEVARRLRAAVSEILERIRVRQIEDRGVRRRLAPLSPARAGP
jgi:hypothetical protein